MKRKEIQIDNMLLFTIFCFIIFSLVVVYSGSGQYQTHDPFYFVKRQVIWYIIGIGVMAGVAYFDFELLEKLAAPLYVTGVVLLTLVHFFGTFKNGSQRWINLGFFELQPSEFMKVFIIIYIAVLVNKFGQKPLSFKGSIPITIRVVLFTIIPFYLILVQPDLGSALVIAAIAFTIILVSGISFKMIGLLASGFTVIIAFLVYLHNHFFEIFIKIIKPHQLERIYGWLSPDDFASTYGYQLTQAIRGIGAGQMKGSGFNLGPQVQSGRIPEAHTDFIFSVVGEEFGFIGAAVLISLYFILIYRIIIIALNSNNVFGCYICAGVIGLISFQVFQNISMTIGLMPITGIPLPFVSYGGSSLLTNMMALGLVISVNIRSKKYMFSDD
ncbi:rod shape-determining protein RodA [Bacillus sp. FJAT-29790]|uniref:rod shape-determining protein RodA n=1 Tax=Bacillus sp. FJAT-29790 TaxID=1895002 RepID=UPI001C20F947|nr:rod shape-determining protein RodA [Bacillus sp. FJAT-29790]MBU8880412.1 rod shape-determining protein RodA [Bacillus sp. FJAT-29790]